MGFVIFCNILYLYLCDFNELALHEIKQTQNNDVDPWLYLEEMLH